MFSAERRQATYAEIKDYVLMEHGLKVSNLYISQVKRKCGIEVGENLRDATRRMDCLQDNSTTAMTDLELVPSPNLPKSEGARGPVDLCSAQTGATAETARQPQCPEEKEKAIKDALEHFGMV
ncbi:MAG: hypothetical protein ACI4E1_04345 [Lachnospira sp.]